MQPTCRALRRSKGNRMGVEAKQKSRVTTRTELCSDQKQLETVD